MVVGFGEAGGVPPSYALITDTVAPGRRGVAFGIYNLGPAIGAALGIALGATIATVFSWRDAFVAVGIIGVFAAIALPVVIPEPKRGAADPGGPTTLDRAPFWSTLRAFFLNPVTMLAAFGSGATQFVAYGLGNFSVLFLMREKGMTMPEIAIWYALAIIVGMGGGMIASGRIIDYYASRGSRRVFAFAPAISLAIAMPFYIACIWAPSWQLALALMIVVMFFNYFYLSSSITLVQEEAAPNQRVLAGALLLLIMNFLGLGLGPTWVGAASDHFAVGGATNSLQLALYTLAPFYLLAIGLFLWLARELRLRD
jgi:predicted MFS family arabinose efflux permease